MFVRVRVSQTVPLPGVNLEKDYLNKYCCYAVVGLTCN